MVKGFLDGLVVLSVEQAMALPYCTWRLAMEGARVIKVEPPRGDPNRKVGPEVLGEKDMCTHFLPMNAGKEAITLNLKSEQGQRILGEMIGKLGVDVFACNQIPSSYHRLGIDHERLRGFREDLIWLGISGFGPERPEAAYDPMIQAYTGIMDTNGPPGSGPLRFGISIVDMETANQGYCEVMKSLLHRERTGEGRRTDLALAECAFSLLSFPLSAASMGEKPPKTGNQHPTFAPVDVYPTRDGHVSIAVGNDAQWKTITGFPGFGGLDREEYRTNAGRKGNNDELTCDISRITAGRTMDELVELFRSARIPISRVNRLEDIFEDPYLGSRLTEVVDPITGNTMLVAPPATKATVSGRIAFPPRLGEHNERIYGQLGYDVEELRRDGVI